MEDQPDEKFFYETFPAVMKSKDRNTLRTDRFFVTEVLYEGNPGYLVSHHVVSDVFAGGILHQEFLPKSEYSDAEAMVFAEEKIIALTDSDIGFSIEIPVHESEPVSKERKAKYEHHKAPLMAAFRKAGKLKKALEAIAEDSTAFDIEEFAKGYGEGAVEGLRKCLGLPGPHYVEGESVQGAYARTIMDKKEKDEAVEAIMKKMKELPPATEEELRSMDYMNDDIERAIKEGEKNRRKDSKG